MEQWNKAVITILVSARARQYVIIGRNRLIYTRKGNINSGRLSRKVDCRCCVCYRTGLIPSFINYYTPHQNRIDITIFYDFTARHQRIFSISRIGFYFPYPLHLFIHCYDLSPVPVIRAVMDDAIRDPLRRTAAQTN
jgi:hypothetical protein